MKNIKIEKGMFVFIVKANVLHGIHTLQNSEPVLKEMVRSNKLQIIGGLFDLDTGKINLIKE